jgi:hypothetical protein
MSRNLRTSLLVIVVSIASLAAASATRADDGSQSQLSDTSHQVSDIQRKIAALQARGQQAKAGVLSASATCGYDTDSSQVFAQWGDSDDYALAPQGDFTDTSQWTFKNAQIASDANPLGGNAIVLAKGDSEAISPAMCVTLDNPTIRLMLKDVGGNGKANVKLDVLYEDLNGHVQHLTLAKLKAGSDWSPSITIPIGVNILSTASASGWTAVAFDFKVEGLQKNETLELASLYVDPYRSR